MPFLGFLHIYFYNIIGTFFQKRLYKSKDECYNYDRKIGDFGLSRFYVKKGLSNLRKGCDRMGQKLSRLVKKGIFKIVCLSLGIIGILSLVVVASFGWFSSVLSMQNNGMSIVVSADSYEILIDRTNYYTADALDSDDEPLYPNISEFFTYLEDDHYDLTETSTADAPKLAFELTNEYVDSEGNRSLLPGARGTLTFYVRPREGAENMTIHFSLQAVGYQSVYNNELSQTEVVPAEDATAINMLKGHLLFFTGRTGATYDAYRYTGLITTGGFDFDLSAHETYEDTDTYQVTLYWEWPVTYDEIYENTSTTSPAVTKKYPSELSTYVAGHRNYFFASRAESNDVEHLIDGYNDGDQVIGDNVNFIGVLIW